MSGNFRQTIKDSMLLCCTFSKLTTLYLMELYICLFTSFDNDHINMLYKSTQIYSSRVNCTVKNQKETLFTG